MPYDLIAVILYLGFYVSVLGMIFRKESKFFSHLTLAFIIGIILMCFYELGKNLLAVF